MNVRSPFLLNIKAIRYMSIASKGPIGVFDSGYGGLTILKQLREELPDISFMYLGDNARAPYGNRSFDVVYRFTLEAVKKLFDMGCPLVILACNTASAKALRTIQQVDLPQIDQSRRVLGVVRPTVEAVAEMSQTGHIGVFATAGTIASESYPIELHKLNPDLKVVGQSCPMWVPLIETGEANEEGADYFVRKYIDQMMSDDKEVDTVILGCTHYPIMIDKIRSNMPSGVSVVAQGDLVAKSLKDYLERHHEMAERLDMDGKVDYYTTEEPGKFEELASVFLGHKIKARKVIL